MNRLEGALRRAAADLDRRRRTWALVGGFAVSARAVPRFTRDVDIAVAVADDSGAEYLEAARAALQLITARGFNRERDLIAALGGLLAPGDHRS